jgi:hypothetical protein
LEAILGKEFIRPHISTNSWAQWHMPVIPATQEAEMRRIEAISQPG